MRWRARWGSEFFQCMEALVSGTNNGVFHWGQKLSIKKKIEGLRSSYKLLGKEIGRQFGECRRPLLGKEIGRQEKEVLRVGCEEVRGEILSKLERKRHWKHDWRFEVENYSTCGLGCWANC